MQQIYSMLNNLTFQYPTYFIVLCALVALVYALGLYFRENKLVDISSFWKWMLALLRFLGVFGILLLLLGPMFKLTSDQIQNPSVVIVQDGSSSINSDQNTKNLLQNISAKLEDQFQVDAYNFDNDIHDGLLDTCVGKSTNLSNVFDYLDETYANQHLGAIILATDGIYNEGINPFYHKNSIKAPLYIVPQGDTTVQKDVVLKKIYHNKIAYLGDKFVIQADVAAFNASGVKTKVIVYKDRFKGPVVGSKSITLKGNRDYHSVDFEIDANKAGLVKYVIEVQAINGEFSTQNNRQDIYIDVLDSRQKVLILASSPHPDISALRQLILNNKNYQVEYNNVNEFKGKVGEYDLVILHNLPNSKASIPKQILDSTIPKWYIVGTQTQTNQLNSLQNVVSITGKSARPNEVTGVVKSNFTAFKISNELQDRLKGYAPLLSQYGKYVNLPGSQVLIAQKIGQVEMDYPLLAFKVQGDQRTAMLAGEGIWKWKLNNYIADENFDVVQELVNQTVQYLTIKADKRKFRANPTQQVFKEYSTISFDAELYNESYEKVNDPDASIVIKSESGEEYPYTFSKSADFYTLDAGTFSPGSYSYSAKVQYNGESYTSSGKFSVKKVELEAMNLTANHSLLQSLVEKHNGQLVYNTSADSLLQAIERDNPLKPIIYQTSKTESMMNMKWPFFLLIFLFIVEWFMRRLKGSY